MEKYVLETGKYIEHIPKGMRHDIKDCPHAHTTKIMTGHRWYIAGDIADDERVIVQCLDCGRVLRDDGTWGYTMPRKVRIYSEHTILCYFK